MKEAVVKNPAFFCLEQEDRYRRLSGRLESLN
jgi:hypothetical protein